MTIVNIKTGNKSDRIPRRLQVPGHGLVTDPSEGQAALAGYYPVAEWTGDVPEGQRIASYSYEIDEDGIAQEVVTFEPIPPPEPVPADVVAMAGQLRELLEGYFGDGAHLSRKVTEGAVLQQAQVDRAAKTLTAERLADYLTMERLFGALTQYTGTGETWTLFERLENQDDTD